MEIGGNDVIIDHNLSQDVCKTIIKQVLEGHWPDLVIEEDDSLGRNETFWYRNQQAKDSWDTDEPYLTEMIYTIIEDERVTVVHDGNDLIAENILNSV